MVSLDKTLTYITKGLLLAVLVITPAIVLKDLFFPFVSGRVYVFRLLVELTLFFWILLIAREPVYRPRLKNPLVLGSLLFLVGLVVTALLGVDPTRSFFSNTERADGIIQFAHWITYFLMISSVFRSAKDWKMFLGAFTTIAFVVAAYAWKLDEPRLAGFFNNPSYLAAFMLFSIGATALLWGEFLGRNNRQGNQWWYILFAGLIIFFFITLLFTQTRGAYLGFGAGFTLFAFLAFVFLRKRHKKLTFATAAIFLVLLATIATAFTFKESNFVKSNNILGRITDVSFARDVAAVRERYQAWIIALEAFRDKPIFGWGPENYDIAFNEHYNYEAAKTESWFDSSHNQALDVLAEGGIFGFLLYLFWIGSVFYVAYRIFRRNEQGELFGSIIASTYLAFLVQGWFLFDTFPMYLGLFPLLGFAYFKYERAKNANSKSQMANSRKALRAVMPAAWVYGLAFVLILVTPYLIYKNVWQPYQTNHSILEFNKFLNARAYGAATRSLEKASMINSPYTYFDVGNQAGWSLLYFLDNRLPEEDKPALKDIWEAVLAREEKSLNYRKLDPQAYYVLGRLNRRGFDQFGEVDSLARAETVLQAGRELSPNRAEYVGELVDILFAQGKMAEGESTALDYASSLPSPYSYVFRGHLYFTQKRYDLAVEQYREAEKQGYPFWKEKLVYARFAVAAGQVGDHNAVIRFSQEYIDHQGPNAEAFFNQAVSYYNLGEKKAAREAFLKALALDNSFQQYAGFFISP